MYVYTSSGNSVLLLSGLHCVESFLRYFLLSCLIFVFCIFFSLLSYFDSLFKKINKSFLYSCLHFSKSYVLALPQTNRCFSCSFVHSLYSLLTIFLKQMLLQNISGNSDLRHDFKAEIQPQYPLRYTVYILVEKIYRQQWQKLHLTWIQAASLLPQTSSSPPRFWPVPGDFAFAGQIHKVALNIIGICSHMIWVHKEHKPHTAFIFYDVMHSGMKCLEQSKTG